MFSETDKLKQEKNIFEPGSKMLWLCAKTIIYPPFTPITRGSRETFGLGGNGGETNRTASPHHPLPRRSHVELSGLYWNTDFVSSNPEEQEARYPVPFCQKV